MNQSDKKKWRQISYLATRIIQNYFTDFSVISQHVSYQEIIKCHFKRCKILCFHENEKFSGRENIDTLKKYMLIFVCEILHFHHPVKNYCWSFSWYTYEKLLWIENHDKNLKDFTTYIEFVLQNILRKEFSVILINSYFYDQ